MSVDAVVFDIGRVLIHWDPEGFYDREIGREARDRLFAAVDLHGTNLAIDGGAPFRASIDALADRHPDWAREIRWWHDRWIELAQPEIPHSVRLMRALRAKGMPVFALTNFGDDSFAGAAVHYAFFAEFDRAYVSARLRLLKPDPAIYAAVEADCGVPPERLFFTDDKAENIAAAAARGWQVHLFEGPQGLADRLVAMELLTEGEAA
jgi:2-haloacid dehalogenase